MLDARPSAIKESTGADAKLNAADAVLDAADAKRPVPAAVARRISIRCALTDGSLLNIVNAAQRLHAAFGQPESPRVFPPTASIDGYWFDIDIPKNASETLLFDALRAAGFLDPQTLTGFAASQTEAIPGDRQPPTADIESPRPIAPDFVRVRVIVQSASPVAAEPPAPE